MCICMDEDASPVVVEEEVQAEIWLGYAKQEEEQCKPEGPRGTLMCTSLGLRRRCRRSCAPAVQVVRI